MHELAVCQGLMQQVAAVAQGHKARRVTRITLQVGPLSGIEAAQLAQAFTIARCGTVAAEAELEIETPPVKVRCRACGSDSDAAVNALLCAACGSWQVDLLSGDELILKSLELAKEEVEADHV
jgi:hydrogenase nickel incorporation protein HypA/HybF